MEDQQRRQEAARRYREFVDGKPKDAFVYHTHVQDFSVLHVRDFYELAGDAGGRTASAAEVQDALQRRYEASEPRSPERSAVERLRTWASEVFADEASRARYDAYLHWRDCDDQLGFVEAMASRKGGRVERRVAQEAYDELLRALGDEREALLLLEGYCVSRTPQLMLDGLPPYPELAQATQAAAAEPRQFCGVCGRRTPLGVKVCDQCRAAQSGREASREARRSQQQAVERARSLERQLVEEHRQKAEDDRTRRNAVVILVLAIAVAVAIVIVGLAMGAAQPSQPFDAAQATEVQPGGWVDISPDTEVYPVKRDREHGEDIALDRYEATIRLCDDAKDIVEGVNPLVLVTDSAKPFKITAEDAGVEEVTRFQITVSGTGDASLDGSEFYVRLYPAGGALEDTVLLRVN